MNALWEIEVFDLIDALMKASEHESHVLTQVPDAIVLTVAFVSANFFQDYHERTFTFHQNPGYLSGTSSLSRFNRRLMRWPIGYR